MKIQLSDHFTYPRLLRWVLPSVLTMIITSVYSMVDGLFISNFVGKLPFATINLVFPFFMILGSAGFMMGTGGSAIVGRLLGQQNPQEANRSFSLFACFTFGAGVVLAVLAQVFLPHIVRLLGATGSMAGDCILYSRIILLAMPFFMLLIASLLSPVLAQIFVGYDPQLCAFTAHALRIYSFAFLLSGLNIFGSAFFTALSNGPVSAAISFLRTLAFEVGSVLLLPLVLGVDGIWLSITVAEAAALAVTTCFLLWGRKKYHYA
ncbi:MAG: MATE family efflux transporter [Evtepia sp.]|nr:MATE family efflux transporter [Evtepia sp.]